MIPFKYVFPEKLFLLPFSKTNKFARWRLFDLKIVLPELLYEDVVEVPDPGRGLRQRGTHRDNRCEERISQGNR